MHSQYWNPVRSVNPPIHTQSTRLLLARFAAITCFLLLCFRAQAQDQLEEFEDEVKASSSSGRVEKSDDDSGFWNAVFHFLYLLESSDGGGGLHQTGSALKGLVTGAWPTGWDKHNPNFWTASYSPFPYHSPQVGMFVNQAGNRQAINFSGHYLTGRHGLRSYSVRSRFFPSPFYHIEAHVSGFSEERDNGDDYLAFYDLYINYNRVRTQKATFWYGAGIKVLQRRSEYYGPSVNMGLEVYPGRPLSFHGTANIGRLNNRSVWETMFRINTHVNRAIAYVGYQRFSVGDVSLGGPILGLGMHF